MQAVGAEDERQRGFYQSPVVTTNLTRTTSSPSTTVQHEDGPRVALDPLVFWNLLERAEIFGVVYGKPFGVER